MARTVVDPVTRANGHLRVEFDLEGGAVSDAWVSGMEFRGLELGLRGRDPRDAWTLAERICGTCSSVNALASVRAVEDALGLRIPRNARLLRNVMAGVILVRDHVIDFYLSQLPDWVDTKSASTADPAATARLAGAQAMRPGQTPDDFAKVKARIAAELGSKLPSVLANGWWGHPAYRLSPEQNLLLVAHMLEALAWQREFMRVNALLGGKDPHPQTFLMGGMAVAPPWGGPSGAIGRDHPQVPDSNAPVPLSPEGFAFISAQIAAARDFVTQVFMPDVAALATAYPEWVSVGIGPGGYLSAGEYPQNDLAQDPPLLFPTGRLDDGNLVASQPVVNKELVESVAASWYTYPEGQGPFLGGDVGVTNPAWPGLTMPIQTLEGSSTYTWIKAARYRGVPMEVGPLARVLVGVANGQPEITQTLAVQLDALRLQVAQLPGVIGRLIARSVEASVVVKQLDPWIGDLRVNLAAGDLAIADVTYWDPGSWPDEAQGFSMGEGPRGTVAHWVTIQNRTVADYQVIDASTWNLSPRDATAIRGPLEAALVKTPVADPARPIEALRVVHSFGPCATSASHTFGPRRAAPVEVLARVREARR